MSRKYSKLPFTCQRNLANLLTASDGRTQARAIDTAPRLKPTQPATSRKRRGRPDLVWCPTSRTRGRVRLNSRSNLSFVGA